MIKQALLSMIAGGLIAFAYDAGALITASLVIAALLLGYFIGYRDGAEAREEELVEFNMMPSLPMTPGAHVMTADAFLNFDDMREEDTLK
jgi:hypothetical protein